MRNDDLVVLHIIAVIFTQILLFYHSPVKTQSLLSVVTNYPTTNRVLIVSKKLQNCYFLVIILQDRKYLRFFVFRFRQISPKTADRAGN